MGQKTRKKNKDKGKVGKHVDLWKYEDMGTVHAEARERLASVCELAQLVWSEDKIKLI